MWKPRPTEAGLSVPLLTLGASRGMSPRDDSLARREDCGVARRIPDPAGSLVFVRQIQRVIDVLGGPKGAIGEGLVDPLSGVPWDVAQIPATRHEVLLADGVTHLFLDVRAEFI